MCLIPCSFFSACTLHVVSISSLASCQAHPEEQQHDIDSITIFLTLVDSSFCLSSIFSCFFASQEENLLVRTPLCFHYRHSCWFLALFFAPSTIAAEVSTFILAMYTTWYGAGRSAHRRTLGDLSLSLRQRYVKVGGHVTVRANL